MHSIRGIGWVTVGLAALCLSATALLLLGCSPAPSPAPLELRALVSRGNPDATPFETEQGTMYLGEALTVQVTRWYTHQDSAGLPSIGAEVADASREAIDSYSFEHRGEQVALIADGQLIAVPLLNGRIVGSIQIQADLDDAQARELVGVLNGR
jgi:hypothetical protein